MAVAGILIAVVLAFFVFRFVAGLFKFALLAVIVIALLWFITGGFR